MNRREKMLAATVVALVALWIAKSMVGRYHAALDDRRADVAAAQKQRDDVAMTLAKGRRAMRQIEDWQARSLPNDADRAQSLYKAWLLAKAKDAGLQNVDIVPAFPTASTAFKAIGYQITASGSLAAVTAMLHEFYRSPMLHQITKLQLNRLPGAASINVILDVEALSLPGALAADNLPEGDSKRLKLASLEEYQKSLGARDLVSVYTPPRPPTPPSERRTAAAPPKFDDAEHARFSGAVGTGGSSQAWITVLTTGETLHLSAGDSLKVGSLEGQIVAVEQRSLVYESDGKKYRVALGQTLRAGQELKPDGPSPADAPPGAPES